MATITQHEDLGGGEFQHNPYRWVVADAAARLAIVPAANDVLKRLWQEDTAQEYVLVSATIGAVEWARASVDNELGTMAGQDASAVDITGGTATFTGALQKGGSDVVVDSDIGSTVQAHSTVLDNTTASYTIAEETKVGHISVTQAVDLDAIETRVNALDAAVVLVGSWDASAGTFPGSGTAGRGESWIVLVAGTVDGVAFSVNDRIVAITDNASTTTYASNWLHLDYTDQVLSVAGKTGAVILDLADITDSGNSAGLDVGTTAGTVAAGDHNHSGVYEPADATILKDADIGVTVAAYLKNNFAGSAAPSVNDDNTAGYSAGSVWIDTTASPNEAYRCTNASTGAAVWLNTSFELGDLGTLAGQDTVNNDDWSGTVLAVANGGTGAPDAATARTNFGFSDPILDKASPGAIGGGTPAAVTGTEIVATGMVSLPQYSMETKPDPTLYRGGTIYATNKKVPAYSNGADWLSMIDSARVFDYWLKATFDRADTGALSPGDLETQAAGSVQEGALTVVDTSAGTVEVLGNQLKIVGSGAFGSTGIYSGAVTRQIGSTLLTSVNRTDTSAAGPVIGFNSTQTVHYNGVSSKAFYMESGALIMTITSAGSLLNIGTYAASTDYQVGVSLGGYDVNGVPYKAGDTKANFSYGVSIFIQGGAYTNWTLLWRDSAGSDATLYASTPTHGATYTLDNFRIPSSDLSSVLQPTVLDTFTDTNGTNITAHTPDVGAGAWSVAFGSGFDIQSNQINALDSSHCITPCLADGVFEVTHIEATGEHGLFFRYTDSSNRWIAFVETTTFSLYETTSGTTTLRASTAITKTANGKITVILDGSSISCFWNGANKLTYTSTVRQTVVNAGVYGGAAGLKLDNFAAFPRTSTTQYDDVFDAV